MKVINTTQARQNIYRLIDETIDTSEPVQITAKKGSVVLVSESDWRAIQETLYLVSIPSMRESIIEGMKTPLSECVEDIGWDIN